jgi:hypothetical protein
MARGATSERGEAVVTHGTVGDLEVTKFATCFAALTSVPTNVTTLGNSIETCSSIR